MRSSSKLRKRAEYTRLTEVCLLVTDGTHDSPKIQRSGIPLIKGKNISSGHIDFESCDFISEKDHIKCVKRVKPQIDDVLFANIGSVGDVARVNDDRDFSIKNVALFRPDPGRIDPTYLYYLINSPAFKGVFLNVRSGAAQPFISLEAFRSHRFPYNPYRNQQEAIANILSTYDDLIENNRRRMALLEESARLLFQEWFVRLRFPGHEHTRIVDGVPEGWRPKVLEDLCTEVRDTVLPEKLEPDTPYIGLEHMPRRSIALSEWGKSDQVMSTKHRFREGEILFAKIRPYFHKVGIAFVEGVASSDAIILQPLFDHLRGLVLMTVSSDPFIAEAAQTMREGSKMPRADWKLMKQYIVAVPPDGLLKTFNETISDITGQLKVLTFQNQKLRQARDLLLPRLMSGEIAV